MQDSISGTGRSRNPFEAGRFLQIASIPVVKERLPRNSHQEALFASLSEVLKVQFSNRETVGRLGAVCGQTTGVMNFSVPVLAEICSLRIHGEQSRNNPRVLGRLYPKSVKTSL